MQIRFLQDSTGTAELSAGKRFPLSHKSASVVGRNTVRDPDETFAKGCGVKGGGRSKGLERPPSAIAEAGPRWVGMCDRAVAVCTLICAAPIYPSG